MNCNLILLAAGIGSRFGVNTPKAFYKINGLSILEKSLEVISKLDYISSVFIAVPSEDFIEEAIVSCSKYSILNKVIYVGGTTRRESVLLGLKEIHKSNDASKTQESICMIHDSARCFASQDLFNRVFNSSKEFDAVTCAIQAVDSTVLINEDKTVASYLNRQKLYNIQTPQAFNFELIYKAHLNWNIQLNGEPTDDASMVMPDFSVQLVEGEKCNRKVTFLNDINITNE